MRSFFNGKNLVLVLILVAFFVYTWRLEESLLFVEDTARDTLAILKLWQEKELTLIGPPISFGQYDIRQMFFGSFSYYIGLVGLLFSSFNPVGAAYPNIVLFILSIPFFYLFIKRLVKEKPISYGATLLYALSPITVYHARFFWNPNLIIPFSVFFWYLLLKKSDNVFWRFFTAGLIGGVMTNLHYASLLPLLIYLAYLFIGKKVKRGLFMLFGFLLSSIPLILFELRNNFYLLRAAFYNIQHLPPAQTFDPRGLFNFFDGVWAITGLRHAEFPFPTFPLAQPILFIFLDLLLILLVFFAFKKGDYKKKALLLLTLFIANVAAVKLSVGDFHIRYLFPVFPLLIWFVSTLFFSKRVKYLGFVIFLPLIYTTYMIINDTPSIDKNYLPLEKINAISTFIVNNNPQDPYNITENIAGGAQAIPFRYILLRDARLKPNDERSYADLHTLYVVSPRLDKIYKEKRWEFTATSNLQLSKTVDFGEVQLFKFERQDL